jgi:hypothetical protein
MMCISMLVPYVKVGPWNFHSGLLKPNESVFVPIGLFLPLNLLLVAAKHHAVDAQASGACGKEN